MILNLQSRCFNTDQAGSVKVTHKKKDPNSDEWWNKKQDLMKKQTEGKSKNKGNKSPQELVQTQ